MSWKGLCPPAENGAVLACPELPAWPALVRENQAASGRDAGNRGFRARLLEMARVYTRDHLGLPCTTSPRAETVIATGHQPVWHHCGIWIKSLACGRLARALGGACLHLVLDHDSCPTTMLVPEGRSDGLWQAGRLEIAPARQGVPLEWRPAKGEQVSRFVERVIQAHEGQFCNRIWRRQDPFNATRGGRPVTVADAITRLQASLYAACGLDSMMYLPVSWLSASEAFSNLVASALSHPMHFSQCYNQAAVEQAHSVSGGIRPLAVDYREKMTELPFWLVRPDGRRTSLHVRTRDDKAVLMLAGAWGELGRLSVDAIRNDAREISRVLERAGCAIRPKAVTLTLFARLYLSDWFIHGVGGVRYEGVTDHMIRAYYRARIPAYGVMTCTAILPLCRSSPDSSDGAPAQHGRHHMMHNPEECFGAPERWPERVKLLVDRKRREIVLAGDRAAPAGRRRAAWKSIAAINRQLRDLAGDAMQSCERTAARSEELRASRIAGGSREYFFGLFPGSELAKLAASVAFSCSEEAPERRGTFEALDRA